MNISPFPALAKVVHQNKTSYAVLGEKGLRNLTSRHLITPRNITSILRREDFSKILMDEARKDRDIPFEEAQYLPFIPNSQKIFCIGVNYPNRHEEYKDNQSAPPNPSVFIRYKDSFVGHLEPLLIPPESEQLDYEGEFVIAIGKSGRRISTDSAISHIAGITLGNEGTLRDWVRHAKFNVTQGKNFTKSGSVGPWLIPADFISDFSSLSIKTEVNGELRQSDTTEKLMFPFARIVSYLSTFVTLKSGDLIFTGTPTGAGARMNPPQYLKPGDEVEVSSPSIGSLVNTVRAEKILI